MASLCLEIVEHGASNGWTKIKHMEGLSRNFNEYLIRGGRYKYVAKAKKAVVPKDLTN